MTELQWLKVMRFLCFVPLGMLLSFTLLSLAIDGVVRDYLVITISPLLLSLFIIVPFIGSIVLHFFIREYEDKENWQ